MCMSVRRSIVEAIIIINSYAQGIVRKSNTYNEVQIPKGSYYIINNAFVI